MKTKKFFVWVKNTQYKGVLDNIRNVTPKDHFNAGLTPEAILESICKSGEYVQGSPIFEVEVDIFPEEMIISDMLTGLDKLESGARANFERDTIEPIQKRRAQLRQLTHQTSVDVVEGRGSGKPPTDAFEGDFVDVPS